MGVITYQIGDAYKVYLIKISVPGAEHLSSNAYLIENSELLLVDTGCLISRVPKLFLEIFARLGHTLSSLKKIIISHGHVDHYGSAKRLAEVSGAQVYIHKYDLQKVEGPHARDFTENFCLTKGILRRMGMASEEIEKTREGICRFGDYAEQIEHCEPVEDGHTFQVGGAELEVVHTPGHSPGSICLYDRKNQILFSGDCILPDRVPVPVFEPALWKEKGYNAVDSYLRSIHKIKGLAANIAFPGHGKIINDVSLVAKKVISYFEKLKAQILKVLGNYEMTACEIAQSLNPLLKGIHLFLKISEVAGMLESFEREGLITSYSEGEKVIFRARVQ